MYRVKSCKTLDIGETDTQTVKWNVADLPPKVARCLWTIKYQQLVHRRSIGSNSESDDQIFAISIKAVWRVFSWRHQAISCHLSRTHLCPHSCPDQSFLRKTSAEKKPATSILKISSGPTATNLEFCPNIIIICYCKKVSTKFWRMVQEPASRTRWCNF